MKPVRVAVWPMLDDGVDYSIDPDTYEVTGRTYKARVRAAVIAAQSRADYDLGLSAKPETWGVREDGKPVVFVEVTTVVSYRVVEVPAHAVAVRQGAA